MAITVARKTTVRGWCISGGRPATPTVPFVRHDGRTRIPGQRKDIAEDPADESSDTERG
jgi:hypothetical protein